MRRLDETPIDPEIAAALDAVDASLAGEPVDPLHGELAELALALVAQRPRMPAESARSLDQRVQHRFATRSAPRRRRRALALAGGGVGAALAATIAVVVVLVSGGPSGRPTAETRTAAAVSAQARAAPSPSAPPAASPSPLPQPPGSARKVVQSAQLALTAPPDRIDDAAQEVFDTIGREDGIVDSSTVTATGGPDGYASFQLAVPSAALPQTMAALSRLRYAAVASRTDTTQDVSNQLVDVSRRLAGATALRASLLAQLAHAANQQQVDSLRARIHDAEASIASDRVVLRTLNRHVRYSQLRVTINAGALPASGGGSFTIGKAARDAGHVLTVAAGVALIALAALVPIALVGGLGWWIAAALRRRRREQALDIA